MMSYSSAASSAAAAPRAPADDAPETCCRCGRDGANYLDADRRLSSSRLCGHALCAGCLAQALAAFGHARGLGVCADADAAFTAFERAADLGMADAQLQARSPAWPAACALRANTRAAG